MWGVQEAAQASKFKSPKPMTAEPLHERVWPTGPYPRLYVDHVPEQPATSAAAVVPPAKLVSAVLEPRGAWVPRRTRMAGGPFTCSSTKHARGLCTHRQVL